MLYIAHSNVISLYKVCIQLKTGFIRWFQGGDHTHFRCHPEILRAGALVTTAQTRYCLCRSKGYHPNYHNINQSFYFLRQRSASESQCVPHFAAHPKPFRKSPQGGGDPTQNHAGKQSITSNHHTSIADASNTARGPSAAAAAAPAQWLSPRASVAGKKPRRQPLFF
jgi:hypothetical protein